jgi:hypothetical protein
LFFFVFRESKGRKTWVDIAKETLKIKRVEMGKIGKAVITYKVLQILNMKFNDLFAVAFWTSFKLNNIINHSIALVILIKLHHVSPVMILVMFTICALFWSVAELVLYAPVGRINENSLAYLNSWRSGMSNLDARRHFGPLQDLRIRVSFLYEIRKSTALTFFLLVCTVTINIIICI